MTKYSQNSEYSKHLKPVESLSPDKILKLGTKKDYSNIINVAIISIIAIIILAIAFAGLAMGVVGMFCVYGIQLPFLPIISISSIVGTTVSFIWLKKGWGEHFS